MLRGFFEFLDATGVDTLSGITRDTLEGFRTHFFELRRAGQPPALRTQALRLVAVKAFTRFLWREHFLLIDPGAGLELPKTPCSLPRAILSEAEIKPERPERDPLSGLRNRATSDTLYGTAVRNSEPAAGSCQPPGICPATRCTCGMARGARACLAPGGGRPILA